jgi:hypothetical protein
LGSGSGMALTDKLRDLDQRLLPGTREQDEDAETYLRRVASSRAISPAQAGDVMAALRVYFDVAPGDGDGDADEGQTDESDADEGEKDQDGEKDESEDKEEENEDDES